ncbi:mitochondrial carrier protein [Colletotrichum higginsianum]|nr:mitochondrial carrier protein [Colletotrichum higginsianum]
MTTGYGGTVFVHLAHYQYLTRVRTPNPNPLKNARFWAVAGGGWMLSYLGIITGIAVAQAKVNHYRDPESSFLYADDR